MEIIIPLPENSSANTYKELKGYLKQLELAIHHAQKAVDNAEETGIEITEDSYVCFKHPTLESSMRLEAKDDKNNSRLGNEVFENFIDNFYDELQNIELHINLS